MDSKKSGKTSAPPPATSGTCTESEEIERQLQRLRAATRRLQSSVERLRSAAHAFQESLPSVAPLAEAEPPLQSGLAYPRGIGPFAELSPAKQKALIALMLPRSDAKA